GVDQDVARLEIPVHQPVAVDVGEGVADLHQGVLEATDPLGPVDLLQRESSLRPSRLPFEFGGGSGGVELLRIRLVEEGVEIEAAAYAAAMVEAVAGEREGEGIG